MTDKRVRAQMSERTYDALYYFARLRGVPVGQVIAKALWSHAQAVEEEFPAVRSHCMAMGQARDAQRRGVVP